MVVQKMDKEPKKEQSNNWTGGSGIAIGLALGVVFGLAMDNLAIGIAIGVALGAGIEGANKKGKDQDKE